LGTQPEYLEVMVIFFWGGAAVSLQIFHDQSAKALEIIYTTLAKHLFKVAIADPIAAIPTHHSQNHLSPIMAPLKVIDH